MVDIIPSILTNNSNEALELIGKCNEVVKRVQIDIVDGIFANNKTIRPSDLGKLYLSLAYDYHLMVKNPNKWIEECVNAGADRIIGQVELMEFQEEFVKEVQQKDLRVGLAIDLDTPVENIDHDLFSRVDVILVMSVSAGFGGQKFNINSLQKIKKLNEIRIKNKTPFKICVDGGETEDVIDDSVLDGADEVVVGRRLFNGDLKDNISKYLVASRK